MSPRMQQLINTIQNAQSVEFDCHGKHRVVTPHIVGYKDGKEHILSYQYDGESSEHNLGWRCMNIKDINNIKVLDSEALHSQHTHNTATCVDNPIAKIDLKNNSKLIKWH